jgi:3-phosphoinositide dependent protein kinase-1
MFFLFFLNFFLDFVLELAPGGDLFKYVSRYGKIKPRAIVYYMAQLVDALEYMHGLGILHRDLKPENLIFDAKMQLKVTDFGTAKLLDSNSDEEKQKRVKGTFCGTAQYVSPEVIAGEEQSFASDLWGLGCIIYQLFTSKYPFIGLSDYLIFQKIKERDVEFPSYLPKEAVDLMDKLLQVDPLQRIGTGENGYADIKAHPFFKGVNWKNLISENPPELVDEDIKESIDRKLKEEEQKKNLPPPVVDNDEDDEEILLMKKQQQQRQTGKETSPVTSKPSPSSSFSKEKSSKVQLLKDKELTKEWENFLMKGEFVVYAAPMIKRSRLTSRKRMLLLTCFPRFIYIDPDKWEMKGVIQFTDEICIIPSTKDMKKFIIKTVKT